MAMIAEIIMAAYGKNHIYMPKVSAYNEKMPTPKVMDARKVLAAEILGSILLFG
jgi:hypothetical protein